MSRKWVEKEGLTWMEKGIISRQQYDEILGLYDDRKQAAGILPILGGLLVGLGVLSFVAANWQEIAQGVRLLMILAALTGLYVWGDRLFHKGQPKLGIALIGAGLMTFGAGLFLIAQMYQLTSSNVFSLAVWAAFGILLTAHYRSRFLFLLSVVIVHIAQITSISEFHRFSYFTFALFVLGLLVEWVRRNDALLGYVWTAGLFIQLVMIVEDANQHWAWTILGLLSVYTAGDWLRREEMRRPLQTTALLAAYLYAAWAVIIYDTERLFGPDYNAPFALIVVFLLLFAASFAGKIAGGKRLSMLDLLLFLPFFYVKTGTGLYYLAVMFLFSLYVLAMGYREHWREKINIGTLLFLFTTLIAYTKLSWGFMDKSLFFLTGGILLLVLSWLLNKRKKEVLQGEGGDGHAD